MDTNTKRIGELVKIIKRAKNSYYNKTPIISDEEYDLLEEELRKLDPDNPILNLVGSYPTHQKVAHKYPMLSMQKVKEPNQLMNWLKDVQNNEVIIEPKIDGISASIWFQNGKLTTILTRGDGKIGRDITHIAKFIKVPLTIEFVEEMEIRGELYIKKDSSLNDGKTPLRNLAAGILNRKEELEDLKEVSFIAYTLIEENNRFGKETDCLKILRRFGFETVQELVITNTDVITEINSVYSEYLNKTRNFYNFETDGLVVVVNDHNHQAYMNSQKDTKHHNQYNMAIKPPSKNDTTTLREIDWRVSKNGNIIPVAIFDPVTFDNVVITRATLSNFSYIEKLDLKIGDKISVARNNDVIPYICGVVSTSEQNKRVTLKKCPKCSNLLLKTLVNYVCINKKCPGIQISLIFHWIKINEFVNISVNTIETLFLIDAVKDIPSLFKIDYDKLLNLPSFGPTKVENLRKNIDRTRKMELNKFILGLNIQSLGKHSIEKLNFKNIDEFLKYTDDNSSIGKNIRNFLLDKENITYIDELLDFIDLI